MRLPSNLPSRLFWGVVSCYLTFFFCYCCLIPLPRVIRPNYHAAPRFLRYVVFSVTRSYAQLLPHSCLLWTCRAWFLPIVILAQSASNANDIAPPCVVRIPANFSAGTASQVLRLFAAFLPFAIPEDVLFSKLDAHVQRDLHGSLNAPLYALLAAQCHPNVINSSLFSMRE
jgi:hypothetical protein